MEGNEIPGFGETVATFRTRAGLSQQKVASALGMSRRAIAAWEAGDNLPKAKGSVLQLARLFKLNDEETTMLLKSAGIDPSLAIWNVPFPRNPFFTGRDQELDQLHTQLQQGTTAVVGQIQSVSGLGGIGKTQLAVEYAYRYHDTYQYVLWARAESTETLNTSYSELARLLNLPEKDAEEQEKVIQAVKRWLQRQRDWLLILDNADSPHLLPDFLPSTIGGHLLITTRAAEVSAHLAGLAHPLVMGSFSDEQGALFLLHRSGLLILDATLDQAEPPVLQLALSIAHEIGGLPLALDQAGAYIKATGSSLTAYQLIYRKHRIQLLRERRGADHPEPVATTWNISFRKVEQQNPAAADLLRLCAFLAPDAIPEEILTKDASELGAVLAPVAADAYLLNQAIEDLRTYSLITRDPLAQTLTVHRLVQAVLRDNMAVETQQEWMWRAVHAVDTAYPSSDFTNWASHERLLPHVRICAIWIEQAPIVSRVAARLLEQAGSYLCDRGQYGEAEPLYLRVLAINEQQLGATHPDTARILNNLALLYCDLGRYTEAEPLYLRALAIGEQQLGSEHTATATLLNNLAELYRKQGKFEAAEPIYQRALAIWKQQLGADHPKTMSGLNNLALLYEDQGRYTEAELLYQQALAIGEKRLGADHPKMMSSLNNLAAIYRAQRRFTEAEPLYLRALAIGEQQLGADHPDIATRLNNLAELYRMQGRYAEAEPLYLRALAIREQRLGAEHPDTANTLNDLALLYHDQGQYTEAEPVYQRALAIWKQQLGVNHLKTMSGLNNLAALYRAQGRNTEAEPLYQQALAIGETMLGRNHPRTTIVRANFAFLLRAMGREAEAKALEESS